MILLDYSQVVISAFFLSVGNHSNMELEEDLIRHIILNTIRSINSKYRSKYGKLVVCVDAGNPWRRDVFPYYKASRKKNRDKSDVDWPKLYENMKRVRQELEQYFPYPVLMIDKLEADDIIATLAMDATEPTLIVSSDKDFIQLQAFNPNVDQWDNTNTRWIKHDNPKRYLYNHIMSGDAGDGVPNVLSDDDTFVVDGKRQKRLGEKKIDEWFGTPLKELFTTPDEIKRYNRNKRMIDLRQIPIEYTIKVREEFEKQKDKELPEPLFNYFSKFNLTKLLESVGDFK